MAFESQIVSVIGQSANLVLILIIVVMCLYVARHLRFTFNRLFRKQRRCQQDLAGAFKPSVSILIPMHTEEKVARDILERFVQMDYPKDESRYEVIAIDDGSADATPLIVDEFASKYPFVKAIHRVGNGGNGKSQALNVGLRLASNEIILIFDADYLPPRDCVDRLVAPFVDVEIGGVMGRVVPVNSPESFVSRIMDVERAGGYQIDQQARYNLNLIPQFGGTVGGFRRSVLKSVGGFDATKLAEDTDLTYRLYLDGWKIAYVNAAECYEEAVHSWEMREKQLTRWAIGHDQCLFDYFFKTLKSSVLTFWQKIDGVLLLGIYATPVLIFVGWMMGIVSYLTGAPWWTSLFPAMLFVFVYNSVGNFAVFGEVGGSLLLDQRRRSIWLLPLMFLDMLANVWVCNKAFFKAIFLRKSRPVQAERAIVGRSRIMRTLKNWNNHTRKWNKTERSGNGLRFYTAAATELGSTNHAAKAPVKKDKEGRD